MHLALPPPPPLRPSPPQFLLQPSCQEAVDKLSVLMHEEDGAADTVAHIHATVFAALSGVCLPPWMQERSKKAG